MRCSYNPCMRIIYITLDIYIRSFCSCPGLTSILKIPKIHHFSRQMQCKIKFSTEVCYSSSCSEDFWFVCFIN